MKKKISVFMLFIFIFSYLLASTEQRCHCWSFRIFNVHVLEKCNDACFDKDKLNGESSTNDGNWNWFP